MKNIIKAIKAMLKQFPSLRILNNKDKNGNKCIVVLGLEAYNTASLPPQVQALISAVDSYGEGYAVSYTPPHKSTSDTGVLYCGKPTQKSTDVDSLSF